MTTINAHALALATALDAALRAADSADTLTPTLASVRLTPGKNVGTVTAAGTDRYRVHFATVPGAWEGDVAPLVLASADVKSVIADLKRWQKAYGKVALPVSLRWDGEQGATGAASLSNPSTGANSTIARREGDYPSIDKLMPDTVEEFAPVWAANAAYMADAITVRDWRLTAGEQAKDNPVRICGGATNTKPTVIMIGDWFRALLMPTRPITLARPGVTDEKGWTLYTAAVVEGLDAL